LPLFSAFERRVCIFWMFLNNVLPLLCRYAPPPPKRRTKAPFSFFPLGFACVFCRSMIYPFSFPFVASTPPPASPWHASNKGGTSHEPRRHTQILLTEIVRHATVPYCPPPLSDDLHLSDTTRVKTMSFPQGSDVPAHPCSMSQHTSTLSHPPAQPCLSDFCHRPRPSTR